MLGRGLGVNKKNGIVKYGLDFIPGAVDSCVAFFSYYRSSRHFKGQCVEIMRGSDYATAWFGYKGSLGYIDYIAIALFCSGTTGKVKTWVNGSMLAGVNNAIQNNYANMSIIFESGAFNTDGLRFVAASSNYMSVTDYTLIQITEPPFTVYSNYYNATSPNYTYVFAKRLTAIQFEIAGYLATSRPRILNTTSLDLTANETGNNKTLFSWIGKGTNEFKGVCNNNTGAITKNGTLTNESTFIVGGRFGPSSFHDGNIKSIIIFNSNIYDNYTQLAAKF